MKSGRLLDELEAPDAGDDIVLGTRTQVAALAESADSYIAAAVSVQFAKGFSVRVGEDFYDKSRAMTHSTYQRSCGHCGGRLELEAGEIRLILEPDLLSEAIRQLNESLPSTNSGVLRFDRGLGCWIDDVNRSMGRGVWALATCE